MLLEPEIRSLPLWDRTSLQKITGSRPCYLLHHSVFIWETS